MPITVQHEPDFNVTGAYAYAIGRGQRREQERSRRDKLDQQYWQRSMAEFDAQQRARQLEIENYRAQQGDAFNRYESERNFNQPSASDRMRYAEFQDTSERGWAQQESMDNYRVDQLDVRRQQDSDRLESKQHEQELKYNGQWQFSAAQQQRKGEIEHQLQAVRSDNTLYPAQKEDLLNQLYNEYDDIIGHPEQFVPNQGPTPDDMQAQLKTAVQRHPETGQYFISQPDGKGGVKWEQVKTDNSSEKNSAKEAEQDSKIWIDAVNNANSYNNAERQRQSKDDGYKPQFVTPQELYAQYKSKPSFMNGMADSWDSSFGNMQSDSQSQPAPEQQSQMPLRANGVAVPQQQQPVPAQPQGVAQVDQAAQENEQARAQQSQAINQQVSPEIKQRIQQLVREGQALEASGDFQGGAQKRAEGLALLNQRQQ